MKTTCICAAIICSFFIACKHHRTDAKIKAGHNTIKTKKISKRDLSVTKFTAYNDLFFDSIRLADFLHKKQLPDSVSRRIQSFYNARNYQYAWFSSTGLTEQALGFWNLHNYAVYSGDTSLKDRSLQKKMDNILEDTALRINTYDTSILGTELLLTQHFVEYSLNNYDKSAVKRKELERFIPIKKEDIMQFTDSLINNKHKNNKYFDDVNESYKKLMEQLRKYYAIAQKGGWQPVTGDVKLCKKGVASPFIAHLKHRLAITGDIISSDTSNVFTDTLKAAIKQFQRRLGYTPTGVLTATILKDLNIPVMQRLRQILINMNRMRWMPQEPGGKLIVVNIPEFVLHFVDGKTKIFDMNVVVGKEGHNTMMFTGKLSLIVFSPSWKVPASIVKKEILPHIARNSHYLAQENMEIIGKTETGLPVIRQKPGDKNPLGKVKFLFPNSFDIYFHDTPSKALFNRDKRAYSHGCIRLSDPLKMAEYLLSKDTSWTPEKIIEAMDSGTEKFVKVSDPVPVFITYYTAWVGEDGQLNFRDDIYKRDADVAKKMFN